MQNYLTPAQAAKRLGVTTHTLRVWDKEGKLNTVRTPGNQRRIAESEINRLLGIVYKERTEASALSFVAEKINNYKHPAVSNTAMNAQNLTVERELSAGGSGGNLPKWVLKDSSGQRYYAKARSRQDSFEPEAEICAYHLACLLGIPAIKYELAILPQLSDEPVSLCRDYTDGKKVMSLYRYIMGVTGINPAVIINGNEKFDLVMSVLSPEDKEKHTSILYLDYIVGNKDRHLRNFDVWVTPNGSINGLVPVFDTGDSLFAAESINEISRACGSGNNFVHSKPYMNPHLKQEELLRAKGCFPALNSISREDITNVINSYFSDKRAEYLCRFVMNNAERLGLLR